LFRGVFYTSLLFPRFIEMIRINEWTKLRGSSIREIFVDGFVVESRFGVGEGVREAGCGFRRVCPWGKAVYE